MEALLFFVDVGMMIVLLYYVVKAERSAKRGEKDVNLGIFAFRQKPESEEPPIGPGRADGDR
jgi:hypothetical protein